MLDKNFLCKLICFRGVLVPMQIKMPIDDVKEKKVCPFRKIYYNRYWILGVSALLLVSLSFFIKRGGAGSAFVKSYVKVDRLIGDLSRGEEVDLAPIELLVKNYPELKPLFDHHLMQTFALRGESDKAVAVGTKLLERIEFIDLPYADYAKASLLIETKNYDAALLASYQLKESLEENKHTFPRLHLFNLIRIAMLEKTLGREGYKESFAAAKKALSDEESSISDEIKLEITSHFSDDRSTIFDLRLS